MLYALFLAIAILYNWRKLWRIRAALFSSLIEAKSETHRQMILGHHFYVLIFEAFLAFIVANFLAEGKTAIGMLGLGFTYIILVFLGFFLYQFFIRFLERHTKLELKVAFKQHIIKELRVNFALGLLPILIYSMINWTFQDSVYEEWGNYWLIGMIFNLIFVSVLTIACTVIVMLRLIPNREISEPEYLAIIDKRLQQIGMPNMRIRWIESDIKNAFVVGLKLLRFSNQTMFVGKSLRTMLSLEEFDAVICHELAHVANRHIHKRIVDLIKNFILILMGTMLLSVVILAVSYLYWGEDAELHSRSIAFMLVGGVLSWFFLNYALLFDSMRAHEFEADAYAVMIMGADFEAMKSALQKLTAQDDLPDYLKAKTTVKKGRVLSWYQRNFSTHPDYDTRVSALARKMREGLPFNYYVSSVQKLRGYVSRLIQWRVLVPMTAATIALIVWTGLSAREGIQTIAWINKASPAEIMARESLVSDINKRPMLIGQSLMYHIVMKGDPELIDYFLSKGADKGKTLVYLTQLKNFDLLQKYYDKFQNDLTQDEYYLILRKTAQVDFTEGYRYLVNAERFTELNAEYKESVTKLKQRHRLPASVQKK